MARWLEGIIDPELVPVASWIIIGLLALVAIFVAFRIIRAMTSGAFLMRGRNRKARLAVMDATAIDDKRRLVLVRRDDVEHLILIGGANDVVVEHDIRMFPAKPRSATSESEPPPIEETVEPRVAAFAPPAMPRPMASAPRATLPPRPTEPRVSSIAPRAPSSAAPRPAPVPVQPAQAQRPVAAPPSDTRPDSPPSSVQVAEPRAQPSEPRAAPHAAPQRPEQPRAVPAAAAEIDLDQALLSELQVSLDRPAPPPPVKAEHSLEDEMTKLLGELSRQRK